MLHRLAVDLKMDALLFQLSVFHIFNKLLSDPAAAAYKVECNLENIFVFKDIVYWNLSKWVTFFKLFLPCRN